VWGQRTGLPLDGMDKSELDACIQENCDHRVCRECLNLVVRKKDSVMAAEKPKMKKSCDHSSCDLGVFVQFLFGVKCAGCGSPFVQKAPPARKGSDKKPGDPHVPFTTNPACCCNNLRNRNGGSEEGCSHANCKRCWDDAVLKTPKSDGPRASRRARQFHAFVVESFA
jgi:hypothetical protein